jgi:chromosomal replication initiator protein
MSDFDPKLTFESFVVGPANRLAFAAARRAADSPGTSYNPLFVYSASGLGKTHILTAVAHQALRTSPGRKLEYMALEKYLERLESAIEDGSQDSMAMFKELDILLLDDVQFVTGQPEAQEMLLRTLDELSASGSQVVLASDRPPADINGLDARLLSRFSGGLIVDIGMPEYETRVAIIRKKAEERGQTLEPGVAEALARHPFRNVRELGGGLNKILATQELEERRVRVDEVSLLMGPVTSGEGTHDAEFDSFLDDLVTSLAEVVEEKEEPWRRAFREAVDGAEREGFSSLRLDPYLKGSEPEGWEEIVQGFRRDVDRLREIEDELDELGNPWPEAAAGVLKDPDRIGEAESLLASVRERQRPFPRLARGQLLTDLEDFPGIVLKAAAQLVGKERPEYNPLFVATPDEDLGKTLLGAAGRTYQVTHPEARMAVTSLSDFADDFIRALGEGIAGAWRERWWTVDLLLVHGVEALSETERAQDEFFHLFEALKRRGARVLLLSDRVPAQIGGVDDRLRSRFEGGLVLELNGGTPGSDLILEDQRISLDSASFVPDLQLDELLGGAVGGSDASVAAAGAPADSEAPEANTLPESAAVATSTKPKRAVPPPQPRKESPARAAMPEPAPSAEPRKGGAWFPSRENAVIYWPRAVDLLIEELD